MAALQDQPGRRDHAVSALTARQLRRFLDTVKRHFGRAPEYGEHRLLAQSIDGVVAPFAARYLAALDVQDLREFFAVEGYAAAPDNPVIVVCLAAGLGGQRQLYGLGFAQRAPPVMEAS